MYNMIFAVFSSNKFQTYRFKNYLMKQLLLSAYLAYVITQQFVYILKYTKQAMQTYIMPRNMMMNERTFAFQNQYTNKM